MVPPNPHLRSKDSTFLYALIIGISLSVFSFYLSTGTSAQGSPTLSIANTNVVEGEGGGTTDAVFTVTLSASSSQTVTVNYATSNNFAVAPSDYTATTGTLSFNAGETTKTITVPVIADCVAEATEDFRVNLSPQ